VTEQWSQDALVFDETALTQLFGAGEAPALSSYYALFIEQALPLLEIFHPEREQQSLQVLEKLAHKLKSSSSSVGAHALGEILGMVETACLAGDQAALARLVPQTYTVAARTLDAMAAFQSRLTVSESNAQKLQD